MAKNFNYTVLQKIATIDESRGGAKTKELRLIRYDHGEYYDLREWEHLMNGDEQMGKGITLKPEALNRLRLTLDELASSK